MNPTSLLASRPGSAGAAVSPRALQPGAAPLARPRIPAGNTGLDEWFLTAAERGNSATRLDSRHPDGAAWTTGNQVRLLLHGAEYFTELLAAVRAMDAGDLLLFTDWRGDPDERLDGPGTEVSRVLAGAARRGVIVRGLLWRSHLDRFRFSLQEHRDLGEAIVAAGGELSLPKTSFSLVKRRAGTRG
jgi:phosphatidylserine/phosphatidylglycerophosphate/cardiolipin synthase-like enzyme